MRAVIQRVYDCTLSIDSSSTPYSEIKNGLLILLGVENGDDEKDSEKLARKISSLRIFSDSEGKMNLSCTDPEINGEFMVVSQFTLCGDCSHGRRPNMMKSAPPSIAIPLYEHFVSFLREECKRITSSDRDLVKTGVFGADMQIKFTNDGPVTFIIESGDLK